MPGKTYANLAGDAIGMPLKFEAISREIHAFHRPFSVAVQAGCRR
jgi:hypothetical protein